MTVHTVRPYETITSIARHYHVTVKALVSENNLRNSDFIGVGQTLEIPKARDIKTPDIPKPKPKKQTSQDRDKGFSENALEETTEAILRSYHIASGWLDGLLQRLRHREANESVQHTEKIKVTPANKSTAQHTVAPANGSSYSPNKLSDVKKALQERLGKEPHIVTFNGVKLSQNERMQIIASVATCEMNKDGFGSINADQEFVGRKFGRRGIEVGYSRIVHIGLSYGIIQYTQDGGPLGQLLQEMQSKNSAEFIRVFGGGDKTIADLLVTTTTSGHPDVATSVPLSGQQYWNSLRSKKASSNNKAAAKELKKLSITDNNTDGKSDLPIEREIRGRRVQPVAAIKGTLPTDIWIGVWKQRFLDAGAVIDFQEAQLELAVRNYFNPVLHKAKQFNVRSALALAFMAACSVRWGPTSPKVSLIIDVAKEINVQIPFVNGEDEIRVVRAIANAGEKSKVGSVAIPEDEVRRAKLLIADQLKFLAEDYYDISSY